MKYINVCYYLYFIALITFVILTVSLNEKVKFYKNALKIEQNQNKLDTGDMILTFQYMILEEAESYHSILKKSLEEKDLTRVLLFTNDTYDNLNDKLLKEFNYHD